MIKDDEIKKLKEKILSLEKYVKECDISNKDKNFNSIKNNMNNINKMNENAKNNLLLIFNKPPLVGLNNIGASFYMNSTLQCLSQTFPLTNYMLDPNNKQFYNIDNLDSNDEINLKLTPSYAHLIKQLWFNKDGNTSFAPYFFKNTINKLNPLLQKKEACDAKDLIIFILKQMHKELRNPIIDSKNNSQNLILNQYNRKNVFYSFINNYKKKYSIISEIFYGFKEITNICLNCENICKPQNLDIPKCYNYDIFNCLIFPLEEIKKMKYINISVQNKNSVNNSVTIYDCFEYNQRTEKYTGKDQKYCNLCKQFSDSIYSSKIYYCPNVLILILNRGKDNEYDTKLDFEENIDISEYILEKDLNNKIIYNLYGVISHTEENEPSSHFIANCKSAIDGNWYRFDDILVEKINNIQKEVIEFGSPYILFYNKQNYDNNIIFKFNSMKQN